MTKRSEVPYIEQQVKQHLKILNKSRDDEARKQASKQLMTMAKSIDSELASVRHFIKHGWN